MLINTSPRRPNRERIRRIKATLHTALELSDDAMVTVAELTCLEEDCAPVETVFGLLRPNAPQLQHKVHKATDAVVVEDLMEVCAAWGFEVQMSALDAFTQEN